MAGMTEETPPPSDLVLEYKVMEVTRQTGQAECSMCIVPAKHNFIFKKVRFSISDKTNTFTLPATFDPLFIKWIEEQFVFTKLAPSEELNTRGLNACWKCSLILLDMSYADVTIKKTLFNRFVYPTDPEKINEISFILVAPLHKALALASLDPSN
jgi:hypothetical protein